MKFPAGLLRSFLGSAPKRGPDEADFDASPAADPFASESGLGESGLGESGLDESGIHRSELRLPVSAGGRAARQASPRVLQRSLRHSAIIALEIVAAFALVLGLGLGGMVWRLSRGPVDLSRYAPNIEAVLVRNFGGRKVKAHELALAWSESRRRFELQARDVDVAERSGAPLAHFDEIGLGVRAAPLLIGRVSLARAYARGGEFSIVRFADGRIGAGLGPPGAIKPPDTPPKAGAWDQKLLDGFDAIDKSLRAAGTADFEVEDARLHLVDIAGPGDLQFAGAGLKLQSQAGKLDVAVGLLAGGGKITLSALYPRTKRLTLGLSAKGVAADSLLAGSSALSDLGLLAGEASADLTRAGGLMAARVNFSLTPDRAGGTSGAGGSDRPGPAAKGAAKGPDLKESLLAGAYEAKSDRFVFANLRLGRGASLLAGRLTLDHFAAALRGAPGVELGYDLALASPRLDLGREFASPVGAHALSVKGGIDFAHQRLRISSAVVSTSEGHALANGALTFAPDRTGLRRLALVGEARSDGYLSVPEILAFWPVNLGRGGRDWVAANLHAGRIFSVAGRFDLSADRPDPDRLPDEAIDLRFSFDQGVVTVRENAPPAIDAKGSAYLRGNSFFLDVTSATASGLLVNFAKLEIPAFKPKGLMLSVTGKMTGALADVMAGLAASDPRVAQSLPVAASRFQGDGAIDFLVRRPMLDEVPLEGYVIDIKGDFRKAGIAGDFYGLKLGDGALKFSADNKKVALSAGFASAEAPIALTADLPYDETGAAFARLSGRLTPAAISAAGLPIRAAFAGAADFSADFQGQGFGLNAGQIKLDLTPARVDLPGVWQKPARQPAQLSLDVTRRAGGAFDLRGFEAAGPGLAAKGAAAFASDGRLESARLEKLKLGDAVDVAGTIDRSPDGSTLKADLTGRKLDISAMVAAFRDQLQNSSPNPATPAPAVAGGAPPPDPAAQSRFQCAGALDLLVISDGLTLKNVRFTAETAGSRLLRADLDARTRDDKPTRFSVEPGDAPELRNFVIEADDAGAAASPFLPKGLLRGGKGRVDGVWSYDPHKASTIKLVIDDLRLAKAPALAQVLSLASFTGLADTFAGDGVGFKQVSGLLTFKDGRAFIENGRASGAAMGFTLRGLVDFSKNTLDLEGVLVPSYGLNSIIGKAPGLGEVLTSRKGEGVIGVNYRIRGPFEKARASVNPLSVLTPGILRRIFQPGIRKPADLAAGAE